MDHHNLHDLLPTPYTEAALAHRVERVSRVDGRLWRLRPSTSEAACNGAI